jgi:hypothetical protein
MSLASRSLSRVKLAKFAAAAVAGLGVGTLLSPSPVSAPAIGTVPGLVLGGVALLAGVALYTQAGRLGPDCGCGGDCGC